MGCCMKNSPVGIPADYIIGGNLKLKLPGRIDSRLISESSQLATALIPAMQQLFFTTNLRLKLTIIVKIIFKI